MPRLFTRRTFFNTTALAGSAFAVPNLLLKGQNAAGKRLRLAQIGANGKGLSDTNYVTLEHDIVAMVDVDQKRLDEAAKKNEKSHVDAGKSPPPPPKLYTDFRKMFDEMANDIDGVMIATPDHTHFLAAMWAIKHGKHVCVQKPMCNTIWEVRELHKAAKEAKVVTQMGNQGRTMEGQRLAKEWIEQGRIGTLKEIRLHTNRPIWPQGPMEKVLTPVPEGFDWDLWLSSTPMEPHFELPKEKQTKRSTGVHPFAWRGWWAWGSGALGDMGCHIMDATFSILGQVIPTKIEVESDSISDLCAPNWTKLKYHMPASAKQPAVIVSWHDGSIDGKPNKPEKHEMIKDDTWAKATSGMQFIGTDGIVFEGDAYCKSPRIYPDEAYTQARMDLGSGKHKKTEARSPTPDNPQLEWAHCIVNGGLPSSNFDYSAALTEFVLLGNLAVRSQQAITWDKDAMKVTNVEAANQFIKRPSYRPGWGV
jgi:predicted dehydrogenase